jgi:hypothetical protein
MFGLYTPVLILQAFCLYHAYRNNSEQRWYWLILFIPVIGCALYLYHHFYSRNSIQNIAEGVKGIVNTNYKIEQLEKAYRFSNNLTNRVNLADAYVAYGRYAEAVDLYKESLTGFMADDPTLRMKLLAAHYGSGDYETAVVYGRDLETEKTFRDAEEHIGYAWALHRLGRTEEAGRHFEAMDRSFTNYKHRIEYCKFLRETNRLEDLKTKLTELSEEVEHMKGTERRLRRDVVREIRELYSTQT